MTNTATTIEWTDTTLNPVTGCDRVSEGCRNCYALTLAKRLKAMGNPRYQRDGEPPTSGPGFGVTMHPDVLETPFRWRKPQRVFVNSMSDLWHAEVTTEFIAECFAVFALTPQHTYQILTKRPQRMKRLLNDPGFWWSVVNAVRRRKPSEALETLVRVGPSFPLPNVWLGVSVEDQDVAWRIDWLARTPAAVRFLSCEPLLGHLNLTPWLAPGDLPEVGDSLIDWVIAGGESGPKARPMHPGWARSLRDQCQDAGVPFFFKQAGNGLAKEWGCTNKKGVDPSEWPAEFDVRQFPDDARAGCGVS